jgi:hypothetical protein
LILTLISALLVVLALGQAASLLGIWFRYAIPRAPRIFHWLLLVPMLLSIFSALGLAWVLLSTAESVLGLDAFMLFLIYCASQAVVYWVLVAYAVYHSRRGRRCPV